MLSIPDVIGLSDDIAEDARPIRRVMSDLQYPSDTAKVGETPQSLRGCRQPRRLEDRVQNLSLHTAVWFLATRCGGQTLRSCDYKA